MGILLYLDRLPRKPIFLWRQTPDPVWLMLRQDRADDYIITSVQTHSVRELVDCAFSSCLTF